MGAILPQKKGNQKEQKMENKMEIEIGFSILDFIRDSTW